MLVQAPILKLPRATLTGLCQQPLLQPQGRSDIVDFQGKVFHDHLDIRLLSFSHNKLIPSPGNRGNCGQLPFSDQIYPSSRR